MKSLGSNFHISLRDFIRGKYGNSWVLSELAFSDSNRKVLKVSRFQGFYLAFGPWGLESEVTFSHSSH